MIKKVTILIGLFIIVGILYLIIFGKGSTVNWLIKGGYVGVESKKILLQLDAAFLKAWKQAAEDKVQFFTYGSGYYPVKAGQVASVTYGKKTY